MPTSGSKEPDVGTFLYNKGTKDTCWKNKTLYVKSMNRLYYYGERDHQYYY